MAINEELLGFVRDALSRGLSRAQVGEALQQAGWSPDEVRSAMDAFAEIDFPIPVPRPRPYLSAREAFLYLVLFTTLYVSAFNLGSLLFQFINQAFPDSAAPAGMAEFSRQAIRWAVSSLVIAFPVLLFVSRLLGKSIQRDPSKRASKVRKWLTYLTLFVAAGIVIGDLTTLVYSFLGGELSWRFCLKVLTVGAIAGGIFFYYLSDLRQDESEKTT